MSNLKSKIQSRAADQPGKAFISHVIYKVKRIKTKPGITHMMRAIDRFYDRQGDLFGAAITYFSFLSFIPMLMLSFAVAGYILASNADLLAELTNKIVNSIRDITLATTLKNSVKIAIDQRNTVGLTGLVMALYSGINWIGSLREAIRAQSCAIWEGKTQDNEKIYFKYFRDLIALAGLLIALACTLSLTSVASQVQAEILDIASLDNIVWLRPVMRLMVLLISVTASYLLFLWIFWLLSCHKQQKKALLRGTLIAAIGFEIIKFILMIILPHLAQSPSGAAFGSMISLVAFFYCFARLTLFCAAWIATAEYPNGGRSVIPRSE